MKAAIACGGTGGHIFPGVATAEVLRARGHDVKLWLAGKELSRLFLLLMWSHGLSRCSRESNSAWPSRVSACSRQSGQLLAGEAQSESLGRPVALPCRERRVS